MRAEIFDKCTSDGRVFFEWSLADGPDGIEEVHGYATDLITAFSKIIEWRERIAADYAAEVAEDLDTLETFLANDEAN